MPREPDRRPARILPKGGQRNTRTILRLALAGVLLAGIAWVLLEHREELTTLEGVAPSWLLALVAISIINQVVIGYAHRVLLLEAYGVELRPTEWFGLAVVTAFGSLFLPARGGMAGRALYLKERRLFPLSSFAVSSVFLFCVGLLALGASGLAVGLWHTLAREPGSWITVPAFAGMGLAGAAGVWGRRLVAPIARRFAWAADWAERWHRLASPRVVGPVAICYLLVSVIFGLRLHLAFLSLGVPAGLVDCAQAGVILLAVSSVSVTPANLGFREACLGVVMTILGYPTEQVLLAGLVDRVAQLLVLVPLGAIFGAVLAGKARA